MLAIFGPLSFRQEDELTLKNMAVSKYYFTIVKYEIFASSCELAESIILTDYNPFSSDSFISSRVTHVVITVHYSGPNAILKFESKEKKFKPTVFKKIRENYIENYKSR